MWGLCAILPRRQPVQVNVVVAGGVTNCFSWDPLECRIVFRLAWFSTIRSSAAYCMALNCCRLCR